MTFISPMERRIYPNRKQLPRIDVVIKTKKSIK